MEQMSGIDMCKLPVTCPLCRLSLTPRTVSSLQNLPYLICSCSLVSTDETNTPIDFANEEQPLPSSVAGRASIRRPSQPLAMMCGTRVYSSSEAVGLDGQTGIYFIFWDISVRQEGEYKLKFSLVEA